MLIFKRILMNAADAGSGGGVTAAPAPSGTTQPAQAAPQFVTKDDLKSFADELRNGIFADARRAGMLGKEPKPKQERVEESGDKPTPAPDPMKLRELDRALGRLGAAEKLTDAAYKRMERAFVEEAPPDTSAWAKDYLGGFGFAQQAPASTGGTQTTTSDPNRPPVSNAGGVPSSTAPLEERSLVGMSEADVNHLIKTKGLPWFRKRFHEDLRGRRILVK